MENFVAFLRDLRIDRALIRTLIGILVLLFLASPFLWSQAILERFPIFNRPELRIYEHRPGQDVYFQTEWWLQRVAIFENRGNTTAQDVFINAMVPNGRITKYRLFSDQPYNLDQGTNLSEGRLRLALPSVPPGGRTTLYLWAAQTHPGPSPVVTFSAVHSKGAALSADRLTPTEELQYPVRLVSESAKQALFDISTQLADRSWPSLALTQGVEFDPSAIPPFVFLPLVAVILVCWVLLEDFEGAMVVGVVVGGILWVYSSLLVPRDTLHSVLFVGGVFTIGLFVIATIPRFLIGGVIWRFFRDAIGLLVTTAIAFAAMWFLGDWLAGGNGVYGSILGGYLVASLYVLLL